MLQFYEKRSWRSFYASWWFVAGMAVVGIFLLLAVYNRYTIERDMAERRLEAEVKIRSLETRKEAMQDKVDYLGSERGIEAEMRRNFDVAQPGEQVVIILDEKKDSAVVSPVVAPPSPTPPWYQFWR